MKPNEATTKKLSECKIVAKAVQGDKKATHAANSFNCLFYTREPGSGSRRGNKKRGSRSALDFVYQEEQVRRRMPEDLASTYFERKRLVSSECGQHR